MKMRFLIGYRTNWGETVCVSLTYQTANGKELTRLYPLSTENGQYWCGEVKLPQTARWMQYHYLICTNEQVVREEWCVTHRTLNLQAKKDSYTFYDYWKDIPTDAYLYSSAFTESFVKRTVEPVAVTYYNKTLVLRVSAPQVKAGNVLALSGNQEVLGNWDTTRAVPMHETQYNEWTISLNIDDLKAPVDYKYVVIDPHTHEEKGWENHTNRRLHIPMLKEDEVQVITDEPVYLPYGEWKGAGCVIPVFSLRTQHSFGVGDFGDLKKMIDWVALTQQRVLQILPINDTTITNTWTDSYPYNSISIYAFHPQYVDLKALPALKDAELMATYEEKRKQLNALPQIDYETVNQVKRSYLRELFKQEGKRTLATKKYKEFYVENEHWLRPYAAFSYLRDTNGTPDFRVWPDFSVYKSDEITSLCKAGSDSYAAICFYYYVQYILHVQLLDASAYARSKGVVIKGDIPIGISRNSVEAWVEPYYFNLNGQAGAPPDAFSANGQNWGFPTYNWDAMIADGCQWWVRRFKKMAEYFDAYRIDHVLGFFRIWEIPMNAVHGLLGQFAPSLPMSPQEIEGYGLHFREAFFTQPYIVDWVIDKVFGCHADEVRHTFLDKCEGDFYQMKPGFDTQRKVEAYFAGREDQDNIWVRDGLYALISNVLFVRDNKNPQAFHPRISVQLDFVYQALSFDEKACFNRLYNDYFYRRHDQFWYSEAMKKLPVLTSATRMLVCAEDLGMVPSCVPWVMNDLRILTLEIQCMPKNPNYEFGHLEENPYRSVSTISTHDMPTLRGWWDEDWDLTQRFFNQVLQKSGAAPHPMPGWLCEEVVARHLYSPSMLCLLSLQDWLSMDEHTRFADADAERINVPANPRHYWRYRMHLSIEELMAKKELNEKICELIERSGR